MSLLYNFFSQRAVGSHTRALQFFLTDLLQQVTTHIPFEELRKRKHHILYSLCGSAILATTLYYKLKQAVPRRITFDQFNKCEQGVLYDVAIVGAGPSGATCAYHLAKEGRTVLLLEKKQFPRDKFCGDIVTTTAQRYLREMGVMKEIIDEEKAHFITNGGFVSPCGNSFVGAISTEMTQQLDGRTSYNRGAVATVKRVVLDEKVVQAAQRMGAHLVENVTIVEATFSRTNGIWMLDGRMEGPISTSYKARALVCADGAPSKLARHLGIVKTDPNGVCSRAYVVPPYPFKWDGVMFYPRTLLPGYCAIVREVGDELNYVTYLLAGGLVKEEDLARLHHEFMKKDPYISQALGPSPAMERMKAASLRVGGVEKSYDDHVVVVGDAAGFVDPQTGLGIQYAIEGAKIAAQTLLQGFASGDLSSEFLKTYQTRWMRAFGGDFYWSMKITFFLYRFPIFFDATAKLIQRRGSRFFMEWVRAMTGARRKTWFLRVDVFPFLFFEVLVELIRRQFSRRR